MSSKTYVQQYDVQLNLLLSRSRSSLLADCDDIPFGSNSSLTMESKPLLVSQHCDSNSLRADTKREYSLGSSCTVDIHFNYFIYSSRCNYLRLQKLLKMSKEADISDVNKYALVRKLWYGAKWTGKTVDAPFYEENDAKAKFDERNGDLRGACVCGKRLWIDLSEDMVDYDHYDFSYGEGAFSRALDQCRAPQEPQGIITQPPAAEQSTTGRLANDQTREQSSESSKDTRPWSKMAERVLRNQGR